MSQATELRFLYVHCVFLAICDFGIARNKFKVYETALYLVSLNEPSIDKKLILKTKLMQPIQPIAYYQ